MDKKQTWNVSYWLLAFVLLMWLQVIWQNANQSEVVPYSEFERALSEGRIADVTVNDLTMTGRLKATEGQETVLERGARALLDKETLDEAAIRALAMDLKRIDLTVAPHTGADSLAGT